MSAKMPVLFVAHGAPPLLDDAGWLAELRAWGDALPRPQAILMVSAHWEERPATLGATTQVPLLYDFYGFPARYYQTQYAAPGAPALAARVRELLTPSQPVADEPRRGLDHGAFVPLLGMYPGADVPVLQLSLPTLAPQPLYALGQALAPLRDEGVLIVGSGFLTHNLRAFDRSAALCAPGSAGWAQSRPGGKPQAWARELDAWAADVLRRHDVDALLDYKERAPGVAQALPTHEHFAPLLLAAGAGGASDPVRFPIDGFWLGSFTRRSVQLG
jgi:4,5-DOPA dioxygenase extradiol